MFFLCKPVGNMRQCVTNGNRMDSMRKLKAVAATALMLLAGMPGAIAQQPTSPQGVKDLPSAPTPNYTQPLYLRQAARNFGQSRNLLPNPFAPFKATTVDKANFLNTPRLSDLIKDGKIYLSLSDAIAIAIENNFDIAIARYNLDIADTDILRTKSGAVFRGVNSGLVTNTLGGTSQTLTSGGGPGGTSAGAGGVATGAAGIVSSTNGAGTTPVNLDPSLVGTLQWERALLQEPNPALYGVSQLNQNTNTYNFTYNQGFVTGTTAAFSFNNNRQTTNTFLQAYSPQLQSTFRLQLTQHLLQGFGPSINGRFIVEAINDRRIVDASFRQQVLFTVNQIENIYWSLVSSYEDVQAKERALQQSKQLAADNRKQLDIGTLAPLDVVNADSSVATDQQALISAQTNLEYQQLLMKQAIARNLNDPALTQAPVIPTDRISLIETREEQTPVEELVQEAYANRPELEQGVLALKNNETTLKGVKNGLLPVFDLIGFYGGSALGGKQNPASSITVPTIGFGEALQNTFNNSSPDKGIGVNITIPLRNRLAQADQARAMLEYRQSQMRLQQLYTQIRMQVVNQQFALTNDRAQVKAAQAAREYAYQSLDAEQKKYRLGASTTASVLQQQRNLATAENNVISAMASYAKDRSAMYQLLANTFQHYSISLGDAVTGRVSQLPAVPGLEAAPSKPEPKVPAQQDQLKQQQQPQTPPPTPPQ
jgi:outer membrane protein